MTAADFTVEYNIREIAWETFKTSEEAKANPNNLLTAFKNHIKDYFEKIV